VKTINFFANYSSVGRNSCRTIRDAKFCSPETVKDCSHDYAHTDKTMLPDGAMEL